MVEHKRISLVKPTLNTPYHIDFDWWKQNDQEWRVHLRSCLPPEYQQAFADADTEEVDWVDPETAEVQKVDGLQHVLINLILNAREAMLTPVKTTRVLSIHAYREEEYVTIQVSDTGCGIKQADLRKIFDPFFTTKEKTSASKRTGTGLGLAFCRTVIDAHDGMISVESEKNRQTTFTITLPDK